MGRGMTGAAVAASVVAGFYLALGWFRGWTGHRTCRVLHMRITGRTADVSFQPVGWHPRDTYGHPRGPEDGNILQPTCKKILRWTKVAVIFLVSITVAGMATNPFAMTVALFGAEIGVTAVYARYLHWRYRRIQVTRPQASPLASVLSYHLRLSAADVADGMQVGSDGIVERIEVPSTFLSIDRNQEEVTAILRERLPLQDIDWHLEETFPYIALPFKVYLPRPGEIRWKDLLPAIQDCGQGEYVVGVDTNGTFTLSFKKHPHHAWSFATGRGKSTLLRAVVVQLLAQQRGNRVICVDTKRVSLEPIAGIRGLEYHNNPDDIGAMVAAIERVKAEMDGRYAERTRTGRVRFPMTLLVLEEAADLDKAVHQWWERTRARADPKVPPVWGDVLSSILRQGREVNTHVLMITQDFDDRAYGGVGLRNNFELIAMSGWRSQQWAKCIGTTPAPRPEPGAGRMVVCFGTYQIPVQAMDATTQELVDYAGAVSA